VLRKFYLSFCFNSYFFSSRFSMPRPLAYRYFLPLFNQYYTVVLKTCNEVMFFISVIPSKIRQFKFKVSWLCDNHIAADTFVAKGSRQCAMIATLLAVEGLQFSKNNMIFIVSRELVDDSRMRTAIGLRIRYRCQIINFPFSSRSSFLCGNGAPLFFT
jgi:hypothetical protein